MRTVREIENNPLVEIGKYYAYESHGNLCVGQAVENPFPHSYKWAMKNLNTGKIEYPYSQEVFSTEEPASDYLEEEIDRFEDWINNFNQSDYPTSYTVRDIARHFAEWGRNHFEDKSETVSEGLEEYYKKEFLPKEWFAKPGQRTVSEFNFFTAKHFAEWQKEKDKQLVGATQKISHQHGYDEGRFDMREEMMKDAVDATVHKGLSNKYIKEQDKDAFDKALANFEDGDKVKIIIVKTEQQ